MEARNIPSIPVPAARARAGMEPGLSSRAGQEPGRVEPVPASSPGLELGFIDAKERSWEEESERDTAGQLQHLQLSCHALPSIPEFLARFAAADVCPVLLQMCTARSPAGTAHHPSQSFPVGPAKLSFPLRGVSVSPAGAVPRLPLSAALGTREEAQMRMN